MQISNQPIAWQQLDAFRHVIKSCSSSNSESGGSVILNVACLCPSRSAKNRNLRLRFVWDHQNSTIESDFGVNKMTARFHPALYERHTLVLVVELYAGYFKCHTPSWVLFLTTSHDDQCTIFWWPLEQDNTPCHQAAIISKWFLEHDTVICALTASTGTRSQPNREPLVCSIMQNIHHAKFASWMCRWQICSSWVMLSRQYGTGSPCWTYATKEKIFKVKGLNCRTVNPLLTSRMAASVFSGASCPPPRWATTDTLPEPAAVVDGCSTCRARPVGTWGNRKMNINR